MKRHEQYSFSPPNHSSNFYGYPVNYWFLFLSMHILDWIFIFAHDHTCKSSVFFSLPVNL
uniref:Uncharacterized protein n=1 Tax=Lepeophtheirus salmonis TaxID=72036 RepID=A0A0K2VIU2_LEPSM